MQIAFIERPVHVYTVGQQEVFASVASHDELISGRCGKSRLPRVNEAFNRPAIGSRTIDCVRFLDRFMRHSIIVAQMEMALRMVS